MHRTLLCEKQHAIWLGASRSLSVVQPSVHKLPDPLSCGDWRVWLVRLFAHVDPVHYVVMKKHHYTRLGRQWKGDPVPRGIPLNRGYNTSQMDQVCIMSTSTINYNSPEYLSIKAQNIHGNNQVRLNQLFFSFRKKCKLHALTTASSHRQVDVIPSVAEKWEAWGSGV